MPHARSWRLLAFMVPAFIAVAALAWAVLQPTVVCTSGGDTSGCSDYSGMKFFVATVGVGAALMLASIIGFVLRTRRAASITALGVGVLLVIIGSVSQMRL